ncbi:hypothetical protein TREES_T100008863 [Tupaia chinensis]|uniref:Uncharacterized protein n=1 Tax=Tupaia chinensis TaxID=246437 RepID=L9L0P5_TUPCH|nr:hypothetical protein TREES_T100008863 [Tupaia chinensis]
MLTLWALGLLLVDTGSWGENPPYRKMKKAQHESHPATRDMAPNAACMKLIANQEEPTQPRPCNCRGKPRLSLPALSLGQQHPGLFPSPPLARIHRMMELPVPSVGGPYISLEQLGLWLETSFLTSETESIQPGCLSGEKDGYVNPGLQDRQGQEMENNTPTTACGTSKNCFHGWAKQQKISQQKKYGFKSSKKDQSALSREMGKLRTQGNLIPDETADSGQMRSGVPKAPAAVTDLVCSAQSRACQDAGNGDPE